MSKSKGNVLYADDLASVFGVDATRYYLLSAMPFDSDGVISWNAMTEKINADLANVYGNLVKRTVSMCNKYFGGVVTRGGVCAHETADGELKAFACSTYKEVAGLMDECRIADALDRIISLLRRANKYIDETAPWVLAKDEANLPKLKEALYNLVETIAIASTLLKPFMPEAANRALADINCPPRAFESLDEFGLYPDGNKVVEKPESLFARFDIAEVEKKAEEIRAKNAAAFGEKTADAPKNGEKSNGAEANKENAEKPDKEEIGIDDFAEIQLKTALVIACEKVEKSKKLLKLTLKIGDEIRTVVSGIAEYYKPEEVVGKRIIIVYNLKTAKLCGVESHGMALCSEKDGKVRLIEAPEETGDGATVR